ncbi:MAG: PLP-dependent aspartate aminotransferase family protein [Burkholderiaceae bacterium]|jgi:cystathionine gamma-synthase/cystathionine beta-lyase|nr:PLP-dependent aspartate aminotransferase family protein [Burkholderiaceae bacterium]
MQIETLLAQAGMRRDPATGSLSVPIYQTATFSHPALGKSTGYDYSRSGNPTRAALESVMAEMDGGAQSCAFASGLAALDATLRVLPAGTRLVVSEDPYGGTVRLVEHFFRQCGLEPVYVDTANTRLVARVLKKGRVSAVLLEIPTNPLLRVADVRALAQLAHQYGALLIVDNTFLTPYLFRPLDHGADIAVYSATKYLGGHNDVVAGIATAKSGEWGEKLAYTQNATGAPLGAQDSWLLLRGLKTLAVRLERQQDNAMRVARFLETHPHVRRVYYPGLRASPGRRRLSRQSRGYGAMVSFEVDRVERVSSILSEVRVFSFAESLGGVESLITYPIVQTHANMDSALCARLGINDRLLRLSVGIESSHDLIHDLSRVLS